MAGFPPQNITAMIVQAQLAKQQVVEMERSHVVVDAKSHRRK
jgi:hypothetical protein